MIKRFLFFILLLSSLPLWLQAQARPGAWEAGGWAGTSFYFGDLNPKGEFSLPGFGLGGMARYNLDKRLAFKFGINYAHIRGSDENATESFPANRNLSFQSAITEGLVQFEFNFLPYEHNSRDQFFTPYLFLGMSIFRFNPMAEYNDQLVALRPLGTEGQNVNEEYGLVQPAIVYGGGIKVDIAYSLSLNIEVSTRALFTDYLDDVSTAYPDLDRLESTRGSLAAALSDRSGELADNSVNLGQAGRQRGDAQGRDAFMLIGMGIMYHFVNTSCPGLGGPIY